MVYFRNQEELVLNSGLRGGLSLLAEDRTFSANQAFNSK